MSAVEARAGELDAVVVDGREDGVAGAFCCESVGFADGVDEVASGDGARNCRGIGSGDGDAPQGPVVVFDDEDAVGVEPAEASVLLEVASAATEALSLGHDLEAVPFVVFAGSGGSCDLVAAKEQSQARLGDWGGVVELAFDPAPDAVWVHVAALGNGGCVRVPAVSALGAAVEHREKLAQLADGVGRHAGSIPCWTRERSQLA